MWSIKKQLHCLAGMSLFGDGSSIQSLSFETFDSENLYSTYPSNLSTEQDNKARGRSISTNERVPAKHWRPSTNAAFFKAGPGTWWRIDEKRNGDNVGAREAATSSSGRLQQSKVLHTKFTLDVPIIMAVKELAWYCHIENGFKTLFAHDLDLMLSFLFQSNQNVPLLRVINHNEILARASTTLCGC